VLQAANISDLFDARVDGDVIARLGLAGKPAPDSFLKAAEMLGVTPNKRITGRNSPRRWKQFSHLETAISGCAEFLKKVARACRTVRSSTDSTNHGLLFTPKKLTVLPAQDKPCSTSRTAKSSGCLSMTNRSGFRTLTCCATTAG